MPASACVCVSLQVYNINRSPFFWDRPEDFRPERFLERKEPNGIEGWEGYDPARLGSSLYPNEVGGPSGRVEADTVCGFVRSPRSERRECVPIMRCRIVLVFLF